jgi:hypothetical protein
MREFELVRSGNTVWIVRRDEHGVIVEIREAQTKGDAARASKTPTAKVHHRQR